MREISYDQPCYIIAEAGINHNGSLHTAKFMAEAAKLAGADAVKFQTFLPTEVNYPNITYPETEELKLHCDDIGIEFLSTPHSISAVDFLFPLVPAYKIASPKLFDRQFMEYVLDKGKPVIVSINEKARHKDIVWLLDILMPVYFMHTVCQYPAPHPHFIQMAVKMEVFWQKIWGYSDHCIPEKDYCLEAVEDYGVAIIEKHFKMFEDCPDAEHSIAAQDLKGLVDRIRTVEAAKAKTP